MRLKIGSLILMLLVCVSSVFAQLSDEQLVEILRQHHERGSSQMEVMEDMQQKGVSMQRLKLLEQKFREEGLVSAKTIKISRQRSSDPEAVEDPVEAEQGVVEEKNEEDKILKIFGQNLFTNKQLDFNPNLNIPIPDDYVLGPGDEIIIDIWGNSQLSDQQTISPDGDIVLSDVGRVVLSGLKMKDATRRIKNAYAKVYSDLNSGGTQLKVTIGKLRSIQVNILGEVATPGTYTISSLSTVFHALYVAGGISPIGTLRNINVYREGKSFASVDVYQYLMKGENQGDVILKDGDVVLVGTYEM
ncbi:MAG: polysaccharide biosynthesis/export family protein, partial [Paludibacteraceae bacterium]|nr:polysaccharide biosynthesis/export family protein [Paludibacteraceae bacterium]